jgi:hypothetical protein
MKTMRFAILVCLCCLVSFAMGQAPAPAPAPADTVRLWTKGGVISFNVNQIKLSNWAGGGQSSVSIASLVSLFSNYKKGNTTIDNSIDLAYGVFQTPEIPFRKTDDRLELNTKWGHHWTRKFHYSALGNFRSQFAPGYNFPNDSVVVSKFLAPAFLTASVGVDWRPRDHFSVYVSPTTLKMTIVMDEALANQGAFGVQPADSVGILVLNKGKKIRTEMGAMVVMKFKKEIVENIGLETKLTLFTSYTDPIKRHRGNVDVNWETLLSMKVNKFISMSISTNLIYDNDIKTPILRSVNGVETEVKKGPRVQFREVFGLGILYKLVPRVRTAG